MKFILIIILTTSLTILIGQKESKYFKLTDSVFEVGQKLKLNIFYNIVGGQNPLNPSLLTLDSIAGFLSKIEQIIIEVGVYSDIRGSEEFNSAMTKRRAQSIKEYLIFKGIEKNRIIAVGYGELQYFVVDSLTNVKFDFLPEGTVIDDDFCYSLKENEQREIAHSLNRRTIIKIIKN